MRHVTKKWLVPKRHFNMANSKSFLRQIYPKDVRKTEAEVDIIAVHGLDPLDNPLHATKTWSASNGNLWLTDFLPHRNPRIRVLLYGYNSSAVFGASTTGVSGAAENLLNYLRIERKQDQQRPIVWVAHSLGGIVVKKAIVNAYVSGDHYKSIHNTTRGVIFFATPHRGGHGATLGDHMAKICRAVSGDVRNNVMEALRKDSMFASDINKDFARRARALDLRVLNFIESLPITKHIGLVSAAWLSAPRSQSSSGDLIPTVGPQIGLKDLVANRTRSLPQAPPGWTGVSLQRSKSNWKLHIPQSANLGRRMRCTR